MISINHRHRPFHRARSTIMKCASSFFSILLFLNIGLSQSTQESTLSVDVNVVSLLATVRNKQGHIVKDLNQDDFKLEEDGHPQVIRYFARETNLPLSLGLLIDTSLSQRRLLGEERNDGQSRVLQELIPLDQIGRAHV